MSKAKRPKQTALPKMQERTIVFALNAKEHMAALNTLLATLQERIYSTHADLILSEDGTQAKIVLKGNIAQMNNLDGFLRNVPGVKSITDDPGRELVELITCYYHNLWSELLCPHEEMRLSAFVSGMAMRQALLDSPDWSTEADLWKHGEVCYQALLSSQLFGDLAVHHEMLVTSFVAGYMAERGTCELAQDEGKMADVVSVKAEALLLEEQGRSDIIIHSFAEQIREILLSSGCPNAMELLKRVRGQG